MVLGYRESVTMVLCNGYFLLNSDLKITPKEETRPDLVDDPLIFGEHKVKKKILKICSCYLAFYLQCFINHS